MEKNLTIRNSTAEFLIFQLENREDGVQLLYSDETLWLTQEAISLLFDKSRSTIAEHLQNVFASGELAENSVCRKFRQTATDGKNYQVKYYNLDAVISDRFLEGDDRPVLDDAGHVSADYAKEFAETEFEKYRVIQDRLFQSGYDRLMNGGERPGLPEVEQ